MEIVKKNIERLSRLINNVLDFQKLDSGKMHFDMRANDINEVIQEVCKAMHHLVEKKYLKVILNLDQKIPRFTFDKDKLIQVVTNLVNNAIAFTDKGSITITSKFEENNVHVEVSDTGVGITAESLPRLFNPFEQAERQDSTKRQGTGLGLAICKEIILKHNGKIWAEPKSTGGSIFHFTLPLEEEDE